MKLRTESRKIQPDEGHLFSYTQVSTENALLCHMDKSLVNCSTEQPHTGKRKSIWPNDSSVFVSFFDWSQDRAQCTPTLYIKHTKKGQEVCGPILGASVSPLAVITSCHKGNVNFKKNQESL